MFPIYKQTKLKQFNYAACSAKSRKKKIKWRKKQSPHQPSNMGRHDSRTLNNVGNKPLPWRGGGGEFRRSEGHAGSRVPAHVQNWLSGALVVAMCISFSQISSIQLGRAWAASHLMQEWGVQYVGLGRSIASGHPWNCIWKNFKEALEIGNTNTVRMLL